MKRLDLGGLILIFFDEDEEGVVREECSGPYLKMLIKLWPGDWIDQLKRMNQKVDEENGKQRVKGNVRYRKFRCFSSCEFWKNIGCLISAPTFGLGGSRQPMFLQNSLLEKRRTFRNRTLPLTLCIPLSSSTFLFILFN